MKSRAKTFRSFAAELLSAETSTVAPRDQASVKIALVYPNSYEVGMANLGFQSLYRLLNGCSDTRCERAFRYEGPLALEARTLESSRKIGEFDIVAFSISYELDYINVVEILKAAGIPLLWRERGTNDPLVIAGGTAVSLNPAPMQAIMDAIYIGEVEGSVGRIVDAFRDGRGAGRGRSRMVEKMGSVKGVLVPASVGPQTRGRSVVRQYLAQLRAHPSYSAVVTPNSHYRNSFLVEVGRGCARGCSFCAACQIYRPLRLLTGDDVFQIVEKNIFATKKVGLVGAALSDFQNLEGLCQRLADAGYRLGLSSFRLDSLSRQLFKALSDGRVRTIAVAPEAGSERLRLLINKRITDEQIGRALALLSESDIVGLRLYFLIGLPTETPSDLDAIVDLVREAAGHFLTKKKRRTIKVNINTMIPKPWTVFQWAPMIEKREIKERRGFLERELRRIRGVTLGRKSARQELLQGIFSLGGQEVGMALAQKVEQDLSWNRAWEDVGVDRLQITHRSKRFEDRLPWEIVDSGLNRERLWENWAEVAGGAPQQN